MTKFIITFILLVLLTSCSGIDSQKINPDNVNKNDYSDFLPQKIKREIHKDLIWQEVTMVGNPDSDNFEALLKKCSKTYTKKEYKDSLLIVTSYFDASGCTSYVANIDIRNDSLFLLLQSTYDQSCTELEFYKVTYHIKTNNKKYTLAK